MESHPEIVVVRGRETLRFGWCSNVAPPPLRCITAGDRLPADVATRRALAGEGIAWAGDWNNARQLLAAMARRLRPVRPEAAGVAAAFRAERETRRIESTVLSRLLVPVGPGWVSPLPRAPSFGPALEDALGVGPARPSLMPLREILGAIGAHQWFRRGVPVAALGGSVHPRYGVFAPVRGEYVELFATTLARRAAALGLGRGALAFDVGTGTGVLAILLARAGAHVVATDVDAGAVRCARENAARFGVAGRIDVILADLFPAGRARLVVANPPWIPEQPHGPLDRAVYDPGGTVLARTLAGLADHLDDGAEAWLVLSDLAERLELRPAGAVEAMVREGGLRVVDAAATRPSHPRARESRSKARRSPQEQLLATARAGETTRLLVLRRHSDRGAS